MIIIVRKEEIGNAVIAHPIISLRDQTALNAV
jgi:hypothetical protein